MNKISIALLTILWSSCSTTTPVNNVENDHSVIITNYTQFKKHEGKEVTLTGTYKELNVNKRPGGKPSYIGRAYIQLTDSAAVLLETDEKGYRTDEEIAHMKGRIVEVTGTINDHCNAWGNGDMATIVAPCITGLKGLQLAEDK